MASKLLPWNGKHIHKCVTCEPTWLTHDGPLEYSEQPIGLQRMSCSTFAELKLPPDRAASLDNLQWWLTQGVSEALWMAMLWGTGPSLIQHLRGVSNFRGCCARAAAYHQWVWPPLQEHLSLVGRRVSVQNPWGTACRCEMMEDLLVSSVQAQQKINDIGSPAPACHRAQFLAPFILFILFISYYSYSTSSLLFSTKRMWAMDEWIGLDELDRRSNLSAWDNGEHSVYNLT